MLLSTAHADKLNNAVWTHAKSYEGKETLIRKTVTQSQLHYVSINDSEFYYKHYFGLYFPARMYIPISLRNFKKKDDHIRVYFEGEDSKRGRIDFYWPPELKPNNDDIDKLFQSAFVFEQQPYKDLYISNSYSKVYHAFGTNHLPSEENRLYFKTQEEAEDAGMDECKVCFFKIPLVSDYFLEDQFGRQIAAQIRMNSPVVMDDVKQKRIRESGERILKNWPLPLVGYDYSFTLVDDPGPNAMACPAGRIFVTTGLLDMIENEDELDAVMAHEIAHVEKRHGLRQFRSIQKAQAIATGAAIVGALLGGKKGGGDGAVVGMTIAQIVAELAGTIAISGYGRNHEEEADTFSNMYFEMNGHPQGRIAYQSVLKKLRFSSDVRGYGHDINAFSSHPHIDSRIERAKHSTLSVFNPPLEFDGIDAEGEVIAKLRFESQMFDESEYIRNRQRGKKLLTVFASIKATPFLETKREIKDISFKAGKNKIKLDNKEDNELFPGGSIGVVFISNKLGGLFEGPITNISIKSFKEVKEWKPLTK